MRWSWLFLLLMSALALAPKPATAMDWPQYMRDAQHTGDAREERLEMPLVLTAHIELEDAVLTSPVVVSGRVFVVDQMGTAYGIDLDTSTVLWKTAPEGTDALGSNTSSPCVAAGQPAGRLREAVDRDLGPAGRPVESAHGGPIHQS